MKNHSKLPQYYFDYNISDSARKLLHSIPRDISVGCYDETWTTKAPLSLDEFFQLISVDVEKQEIVVEVLIECENNNYIKVTPDREGIWVNYGKLNYDHESWMNDFFNGQSYESVQRFCRKQAMG